MRRILVTGANKGIGFAIAKGILAEGDDTFLLLGSRDGERGEQALRALAAEHSSFGDRVRLVEIDVSKDDSVARAVASAAEAFGSDGPLYAVVNNAGVAGAPRSMKAVLDVNTFGVHRVCEGFLPLIDPEHGRIVNVTSAAGPNFVAQCSEERRHFFLNPDTEWADLESFTEECLALGGDASTFWERGLGDGNAYGLSKACTNTYTLQLARRHPHLRINSCTPGFIETDLTRGYAESQGKPPAELGMKSPDDGARCPLFLLFGEPEGNGHYYGSDALRSPLDRYRSPGSPPYTGD
jgi:NAD(P)-dependent dehydrogenase (short-subunit alcohol dehydrogenase family)